ncbi:MAG: hypothetical protein HYW34_02335 [Candidatus Brennerbacteria bacterium]|nr:hypothetical protein [Candidatus Brennerbacteria bacterium]
MKLPVFFNHYFLIGVFGASFLLILFGLALGFLGLSSGQQLLILHFTPEQGIDFFGTSLDVFKIIIISFTAVFINLFLAIFLFEKERILSYLLGIAGLIFSFLILAVLAVIISVN